ncbi:DsbA family protein [Burkholderia cepacia]|uniref:DsbA family protein n=1 Tax=Burkholderia cepacia TaxID=292 RepID=UPI000F597938|nr:DsbA family protein [Burkholderia cepacia]RQT45508.1 DsbA family protein [Burkholderia cepacia]
MKLIYVGDPMCSWCYGFGNELSALVARVPDLKLEIVVGGVRAGATDVLDATGKRFRLQHWRRVEALSGLPFNREAFVAREGFVYDTEPVCRAVVAARRFASGDALLSVFRALQVGFYAQGRDTTDVRVLSDIAASALHAVGIQVDAEAFFQVCEAEETKNETQRDFARVRALGVAAFPTLLLEEQGRMYVVHEGYASVNDLEERLNEIEGLLA